VAARVAGRSLFYPSVKGGLPIIERAEGIYLFTSDGQRLIDGAGGLGCVTSIGHGVPEIVDAMAEQASSVAFIPMVQYVNRPTMELCDLIASLAPGTDPYVMLMSGGSEATEIAVRLARQHHVEAGRESRFKVITRWQGFHGMTLGASGFSGHTGRRRKFAPMIPDQPHIPPAYRYRCQFCAEQPACNLKCADALERAIKWEGPENVAAFIAEPVVGATLGSAPAPAGYFQAIREICDRYGVLWIDDEVMTGFGRTGEWFANEHWDGVVPDIITAAKGVSGGYTPLAVVIAQPAVVEPLIENDVNFVAGHTYVGNPLSSAIGLAVLEYIRRHDLLANCREQGAYLLSRLPELLRYPIVGDVRGLGLMTGLELVRDRATKEPFPLEARAAGVLTDECRAAGLAVYPGQGTADGLIGDHVMLTPPLTVTRAQIDEIMVALHAAVPRATERLLSG
jgi:adenosylmethionine-8-amino-7-oxononanoate aminotransferase